MPFPQVLFLPLFLFPSLGLFLSHILLYLQIFLSMASCQLFTDLSADGSLCQNLRLPIDYSLSNSSKAAFPLPLGHFSNSSKAVFPAPLRALLQHRCGHIYPAPPPGTFPLGFSDTGSLFWFRCGLNTSLGDTRIRLLASLRFRFCHLQLFHLFHSLSTINVSLVP